MVQFAQHEDGDHAMVRTTWLVKEKFDRKTRSRWNVFSRVQHVVIGNCLQENDLFQGENAAETIAVRALQKCSLDRSVKFSTIFALGKNTSVRKPWHVSEAGRD